MPHRRLFVTCVIAPQEIEQCTFKPEIHPSPAVRSVVGTSHSVVSQQRSMTRSSKPTPARKVPRGYAKSIDRLRRGQARRDEDKKIEQQLRQVGTHTHTRTHTCATLDAHPSPPCPRLSYCARGLALR